MTHTNDHDFQQLRGQFDDAMTPNAAFKAKMEKLLQSEKPVENEWTSTVLASPPKESIATVVPARRSHPLMIAAAVLTVFAVVVASVWVLSGDVLEGEYASSSSGIATLPADAPAMPGEDVQLTAELMPGAENSGYLQGIYEGVIITEVWADPENWKDQILTARNAETGTVLWELRSTSGETHLLTAADGLLIGEVYDYSDDVSPVERSSTMVAIDLESGEQQWSIDIGFAHSWVSSPNLMIINQTIVIVGGQGEVAAFNLVDGGFLWESSVDPGPSRTERLYISENEYQDLTMYAVAGGSWNDQIVILNGAGTLFVLDTDTGTIIQKHEAAGFSDTGGQSSFVDMVVFNGGIVAFRDASGTDGFRYEVVAINPGTGEQLWSRDFDGQVHLAVADNGMIAANEHIWQGTNWFMQLLGNHGHSTFQFSMIDAATGEEILSTDRAKLETAPVTLTDGKYACTRTERNEIVCFDHAGTRYILEIESWGDPTLLDGVLYVPTQDGLYRVQLP